jgi:hypothetical protein
MRHFDVIVHAIKTKRSGAGGGDRLWNEHIELQGKGGDEDQEDRAANEADGDPCIFATHNAP